MNKTENNGPFFHCLSIAIDIQFKYIDDDDDE